MDWHKATDVAAQIAAGWTAEGGPGGAIVLFDTDDIRAEACGGLASLELNVPFTAATAVRYASISKHFLAALLLQGHHAIGLDDTIGVHLPELSPALAGVGVGHALGMTGGLPDVMETQWLLGVPWTATLDRQSLLRFVYSLDALNFTPGTEISYSNTGYRLLEAALEHKGHKLGAALREQFFRPLGLTIQFPDDETVPVPDLATGYWRDAAGWRRGRYGLHFSGSGGLTGTARDLVTWLQAVLGNRAPAEGLLAQLGARRHLTDGTVTGYGLGLARSYLPGEIAVGHGGSLPGYKNDFVLLPEHDAGIVVLSNREDTDAQGVALRVLAALTGAPLPTPATAKLPNGLFVAEDGPLWIEHDAGKLTFLGAMDDLLEGEDGAAITLSAHFPARLHAKDGAIEGDIGHVARRFVPVAADAALSAMWQGEWVNQAQDARFTIAVTGDGAAMTSGTGPLRHTRKLTALDANRALVSRADGPWRQRACLQLDPVAQEIRLVSNRSRMLRFSRA